MIFHISLGFGNMLSHTKNIDNNDKVNVLITASWDMIRFIYRSLFVTSKV